MNRDREFDNAPTPGLAFSLRGKKALVTGGGRGIGRAIALLFARQGADVAVAARTATELEVVGDEIRSLGRQAWGFEADLSRYPAGIDLVDRAAAEMGSIDILANNAGGGSSVPGGIGPLREATPEGFEHVFELNLKAPFFAAQRAAELMIAQRRGGAILNIASIDGVYPAPGEAVYGAAKSALISLTETMAIEYGTHGIRVNAIAPSLIKTSLVARHLQTEEQYAARASYFPINRVGEPDDVAAAALFLCADEADWISGITVLVAGGQHATSDLFRWVRRVNEVPESERI